MCWLPLPHFADFFRYQGPIASIQVDSAEVRTRIRLEFPELRSLAILFEDNMVPLLQLMPVIILMLESLTVRDVITYYSATTIPTTFAIANTDIYHDFTFYPNGFFHAIKQWTTIRHLEIYGIDDSNLSSDNLSELSSYVLTKSTLVTHCLWDWDSHFTEINQVALLCQDSPASWWQS